MLESLHDFVSGLPVVIQWLGIALISAIPFVESYFGSVVGVIVGLPPVVAIAAAVVGNVVSMLAFVMSAHSVRTKVIAGRSGGEPQPEEAPRRQKLRRAFDRYGVAGVSLLGQTILPSQITSAAMVSFGANRNAVILWQTVSILLWGTAFGILAAVGVSFLG